ncbi:MAG: Rpn family recombination-promoting nuclease/putative transposase [Gemmatimonadetes bacterium]|nr:Rpn family recombination-promoting nuclease/putative transposase [Gemmatimonadota bacterium]MYG23368.1 Rpn family recombination-promoting nuclease/putative transposase [Gemmatimonadota bacterium]MYJ37960.1 Rpn family recombination-promoting nuclease/putative transposase [Gemmatimonadota bacterium]
MDYTVRILRGLDKDDLGPAGVHPPVLPVVIYNGERRWTAATDVRDLFAPVPDELLGYLPRHRYLLIEVQSLGVSELPSDNVFSLIASFEQGAVTGAVRGIVGSVGRLAGDCRRPGTREADQGLDWSGAGAAAWRRGHIAAGKALGRGGNRNDNVDRAGAEVG